MVLGTVPKDICQIKDFAIFNQGLIIKDFTTRLCFHSRKEAPENRQVLKRQEWIVTMNLCLWASSVLGMYQAEGAMTHKRLHLHPTHQSFMPVAEKLV